MPPRTRRFSSGLSGGLLCLALAFGALLAPRIAASQGPLFVSDEPALPPGARALPPPQAPAFEGEAPLTGPEVQAASAILVDAATGTVIWEKNAHERRPNASTTKIMTATLMIESGRLDDVVTFSDRARATDYANLNAKPGEKFRMRELLYAVMMRSSNDSCVAVAEHLAGSPWRFALQMTQKAQEIGAVNTNFVTTNGLYHPQHYSTAYDLALMARYAMRYPEFNDAARTQSRKISRSLNWKDTLLKNHNKFLARYEGADGVKTGYVSQSGRCLVASATRLEEGRPWRLVTVVLNSADHYGDSARMMNWGRKNFQPVFFAQRGEQLGLASVQGGASSKVPLVAAQDLVAIVRRDSGHNREREVHARREFQAPVGQDQVGGRVVAMLNGRPVAQVDLVAAQPVRQVWMAGMAPWTGWSMLVFTLVLGPRYARAFAKSARRRRRRLAARRRSPGGGREGLG